MIHDVIIVGAGSAGSALAGRLSENPRFKVLLIEAGGSDRRFFIDMPLGYGKLFYDRRVNWMYETEPDPSLAGNRDFWPRGKVLGGSSAINAMVYARGNRADYEAWEAAGNPGWGWPVVLACFKAMEDDPLGDPAVAGRGGPLRISTLGRDAHPLCAAYLASARAVGLRETADFNGADQEGVGLYKFTIRDGRRVSAAHAFLRPAMGRNNLSVVTDALVTSISFDGRRATGVAYERQGMRHEVKGREIIIAAGAVNSVQLLSLSGIGPAAHLAAIGIPVRADLPGVGANLMDHVGINYTWRMRVPTLNDSLRPWSGKFAAGLRYLARRRGPLSLSINQAGGFVRTDPAQPLPNMQLYMQAFSTLIPKPGERPLLNPDPFSGMSLGLSNCRPRARGAIAIRSADPRDPPRITANALGDPGDVAELIAGAKLLRRIAAAEPLRSLIAEELRPGDAVQSDDEMIADLRQRSGTVYHPCGTCRMGPDPAKAVVDHRLRVHGIEGLRVCDASIFPGIIAGNTNAPSMMVGWRGAQLIAEDLG